MAEAGETLLLVGPNGAGKTTLLRCLAGLARPTRGQVLLDGRKVRSGDPASRRSIGFVAHQTWLHDDLTLLENLTFAARLHGLSHPRDVAQEAIGRAGLSGRQHDRPPALSRGMQQRAAIARSLLHGPRLLLLDEPFTGLDALAGGALRDLITTSAADGCITIIVTHQPAEAWAVATRVVGLRAGRIVLDEPSAAGAATMDLLLEPLRSG